MSNLHSPDHDQHPGLRRSARREQQRRKARHGMRVGPRPDSLHPVTAARVEKLGEQAARRSRRKPSSR
jgi:hypothetical protein